LLLNIECRHTADRNNVSKAILTVLVRIFYKYPQFLYTKLKEEVTGGQHRWFKQGDPAIPAIPGLAGQRIAAV